MRFKLRTFHPKAYVGDTLILRSKLEQEIPLLTATFGQSTEEGNQNFVQLRITNYRRPHTNEGGNEMMTSNITLANIPSGCVFHASRFHMCVIALERAISHTTSRTIRR